MNSHLDANYWNNRWLEGKTGWDIGYASPAVTSYFSEVTAKDSKILIPGCGNAYEAAALEEQSFTNIHLLDISQAACENLQNRFSRSKNISVHCEDFFQHKEKYNYIIEQTFFCALDPNARKSYVIKMHELLEENGVLTGLLFASEFENEGPPFGGQKEEYISLFEKYFTIKSMDICKQSIEPRRGNELFIELIKR